MNQTAKKLREAADCTKASVTTSANAIIQLCNRLGVERSGWIASDLGRVLAAIADELDELQARAAEASDLRQQLESAEDKAERRKKHIGYLDTALHDKNILLKQRGETIARVTAENADLLKRVPTERERQILDMWPRFEDGEYVWFGDEVACRGKVCMLDDVKFVSDGTSHDETFLYVSNDLDVFEVPIAAGERVKRPVQSVLDADGVEIRVGDTVYEPNGKRGTVVGVHPQAGCVDLSQGDCDAYCMDAKNLTHTRPDSWKRLEEDVNAIVTGDGIYHRLNNYCNAHDLGGDDVMRLTIGDIIRRAKALAGVEVDE